MFHETSYGYNITQTQPMVQILMPTCAASTNKTHTVHVKASHIHWQLCHKSRKFSRWKEVLIQTYEDVKRAYLNRIKVKHYQLHLSLNEKHFKIATKRAQKDI